MFPCRGKSASTQVSDMLGKLAATPTAIEEADFESARGMEAGEYDAPIDRP